MNFKERRILVTGGAGFIGSEVTSQLIKMGSNVTVLDNFSSGKKNYLPKSNRLKIIKGDIRDQKIVKRYKLFKWDFRKRSKKSRFNSKKQY